MPLSPKGRLIVFEGIDGCGKSTQLRLLAKTLRARGMDVVELREPTGGPYGREIRRLTASGRPDLERERELFAADRRADVEQNIAPALARGAVVLLDRYYFSTMAYQGARGGDPEAIRAENEAFAPRPDLVILIDIPVADGLRRIQRGRRGETDGFENRESLPAVKAIFDEMRDPAIARFDGTKAIKPLAREILERVDVLLSRK